MPIAFVVGVVILSVIVFFTLLFLILDIVVMLYTRVPFAPTPQSVLSLIIAQADIKPNEIVYDLGCGDGRLLFAAEKAGAKTKGFEMSPIPLAKAWLRKIIKKSSVEFHYQNFFNISVRDADVVFCFLVDSVMDRLEKKLESELRVGARFVSYGFALPTWKEEKTLYPHQTPDASALYIYVKK